MEMNPKISDWHGKRVWLIGASTGIGAELAKSLAKRGARLALSARTPESLVALNLSDALLVPCDVTDQQTLVDAHRLIYDALTHIDMIIYLAGIYEPMQAIDFDLPIAEKIVNVNYIGALRVSAVCVPYLRPNDGIAFVASVAGYRGLPNALAYGSSKAALIHLAECLYLELSFKKIGVWLINPGFVATRLTAKNDFEMPAIIGTNAAADEIIRGLASGNFEIHFPKRFTRILKIISLLPYRLYFRIVRRITAQ